VIYFIIAALIVLLDQIAKYFITLHMTPGVNVPLIPGIIHLTYVENTGAAFSFLRGMPWLLVAVSAVVVVLIIVGMIKYRDKIDPIGKLALAAVLGGAVSHVFDRAILGYVVDFLEFEFIRFAVMDIADWFITIGGVVFCIYYLINSSRYDGLREEFLFGKKKKTESVDVPKNTDSNDSDRIMPEDDGGTDQT
jgi:signal peptidase II